MWIIRRPGKRRQASPRTLVAGPAGASVLLLVARPIGEPIVQYGPFVMNTRAEIEQAIEDYQAGRLASGAAERR